MKHKQCIDCVTKKEHVLVCTAYAHACWRKPRPDCVICKNVSLEMSRRINEVAVRIMDPSDLFGNGMFQLLLFSTLRFRAKHPPRYSFLAHTHAAFPANICLRAVEAVFQTNTYSRHTHTRVLTLTLYSGQHALMLRAWSLALTILWHHPY